MDYEVFLLSRVHEAWIETGDPHRAVAVGIGATARVITTAAAIMVVVFASFVLSTDPTAPAVREVRPNGPGSSRREAAGPGLIWAHVR